ncbi:hypothetical protein FXO38_00048 [Capsicum annuum]|nr:hypothetical protein FXO37_09360 [Capsicum annuum]KAF3684870.1 hypothetical protein FXO38_00048 [Capsicum annuum]
MPPHRARRNNNDQQPQPTDPLNKNMSHAKFRLAFQALAQAVTVQANQAAAPQQQRGDLATARIHEFTRMSPPDFYGLKAGEDPQLYLEKIRKITQVIRVSEEECVELASYRLKDIVYDWVVSWRKGVLGLVLKECRTIMMNKEMDLSRLMIYAQQIEEDKIRERDRERVPSSTSAPAPRGRPEQGNRFSMSRPQQSVSSKSNFSPCAKCGRTIWATGLESAHMPGRKAEILGPRPRPLVHQLSQPVQLLLRALLLVLQVVSAKISSMPYLPIMNKRILPVLLLRSPKSISEPILVSIPVGESVIDKKVYKNCPVIVLHRVTLADLIELEIVDSDVILGMDWLHSCYASIDCRTRLVKFHFPDEPVFEWSESSVPPKIHFISYLKARKLISKGYFYHLVRFKDIESETLSIHSFNIVNKFPDVFLKDLLGLPPDREIEFGIDLLHDTQPISIPPYRMAPPELKELKEQLKDLLDKVDKDIACHIGNRIPRICNWFVVRAKPKFDKFMNKMFSKNDDGNAVSTGDHKWDEKPSNESSLKFNFDDPAISRETIEVQDVQKESGTEVKNASFQHSIDNTIAEISSPVSAIQSDELLHKENLPDLILPTDNIKVRNEPQVSNTELSSDVFQESIDNIIAGMSTPFVAMAVNADDLSQKVNLPDPSLQTDNIEVPNELKVCHLNLDDDDLGDDDLLDPVNPRRAENVAAPVNQNINRNYPFRARQEH